MCFQHRCHLPRALSACVQGAAAAGFERATVATTARAVTVTLYRSSSIEAAPVASSAVCLAGFGLVVTLLASIAGAVYILLM